VLVNCWDEAHLDLLNEAEEAQFGGKLEHFVAGGGQLIAFNCSAKWLARLFPNRFSVSEKQLTEFAAVPLTAVNVKEDVAVSGYDRVTLPVVLESGARAFRIVDRANAIPLLSIPPSFLGEKYAAIRVRYGQGVLYLFSSAIVEKERVSSTPQSTPELCLRRLNASAVTTQAFHCAMQCGFSGATAVGQTSYALLHFLCRAIAAQKERFAGTNADENAAQPQHQTSAPTTAPNGATAAAAAAATAATEQPTRMQE